MKLLFIFISLLFGVVLAAERPVWQAGKKQILLWPKGAPGEVAGADLESVETVSKPVAGRAWTAISHVSRPTMTVYEAKGKNTGAAVVVFPGGGFDILAIDLEGTEVCDWLTGKGITCVLLKYRVPHSGPQWNQGCKCQKVPKNPAALQDAQRAVGLVRLRAKEWGVDPHKVGVLGFSAGGFLAADISNHFEKRAYSAVDAADKESCRPDFAVSVYPGHLWWGGAGLNLNPSIRPTRRTPPTFLLQAENDYIDNVNQALAYYIGLKNAKVPVEMHLYADGGHAFGLRRTTSPITQWPGLVETWLHTIGIL